MRLLGLALTLLCLPALGGCGGQSRPQACTLVYCSSQVKLVLDEQLAPILATQPDLTVRVCVDRRCAGRGGCDRTGDLYCSGSAVVLNLTSADELTTGPHVVSLTITGADGAVLLDQLVPAVRFTRTQPNGPRCPPTCYFAVVTLASG